MCSGLVMRGSTALVTERRSHHVEEGMHGRLVDGPVQHPLMDAMQGQLPRRRQHGGVVLPGILHEGEAFEEFGGEHGGPRC